MASSLLLGIDTALGGLSLSLCRDRQEIAAIRHTMLNDQAAQLVPSIERVLLQAKVGYGEIDGVVVTVGPGGFTGVRIGLATARAIGLAARKAVLGVTTLDLMARSAPRGLASFLCALPAGREQVYVKGFGTTPYPDPQMIPIDSIVASGLPCMVTNQPWIQALPAGQVAGQHDPALNAYFACLAAQDRVNLTAPLPLYIRPPDAKPQIPLI